MKYIYKNNNMRIDIILLYKIFILVISPFILLYGNKYIISIAGLINCACLIFYHKKNKILFYSFTLLLFISLNFINSMVFDTQNTIFVNKLNSTKYLIISLRCFYIFITTLLLVIEKAKKKDLKLEFNSFKNKSIFFYGICMLIILFSIIGFDRTKTTNYTNHISKMYELIYFLVFFALILSEKNKKKIFILITISLFVIIQDLLYGGRITSLQICLAFFIYFSDKLKRKYLMFIIIAGILFMLVGSIRDGGKLTLNSFNIFHIDTFYMAFESSETHTYCHDILSSSSRTTTFVKNLLNTFFIDTGGDYNISSICAKYVHNNGGGFCFTHFYFWFGYIGPAIFALIISIVLNLCNNIDNIYTKIIYGLFFVTLPRWYCYEPFILIKYAFIWCSVITFALIMLSKTLSKNS